uniref:SEFIR domain-containing protein n=1 Tax=Sphaeramia orbicularis TaxID=375764 RepID=A0A672YHS9_9TELE
QKHNLLGGGNKQHKIQFTFHPHSHTQSKTVRPYQTLKPTAQVYLFLCHSDPIPDFHVSVNKSSKSFTVSAMPGNKVHIRWCYLTMSGRCTGDADLTTIDPSQTPSAVINFPYLLPCTCVEAYYTYSDAKRSLPKCPLRNTTITDVSDVWYSAEVELHEQLLVWRSKCPVSDAKISASLCWKQHEHLCTPVFNLSQVEKEERHKLIYNTSAVDKHPQMCVQFSLQGSHNISCPFQADMSSWEVNIEPGVQRVFVYITSSVAAKFSAQLCILKSEGCAPIGVVHSGRMNNSAITINVLLSNVTERPCVQCIFCVSDTHNRCGMYAVAALVFVVIVTLLGMFIHRLTKKGAAGWLYIQKPVLLVCSSEHPAHISAVCTLASILQADLGATVHLALWAQSSQNQPGTGVADLGPIPWLYGQWETVLKAQGNVLIIWTPEAKQTYEKWWDEMGKLDKSDKRKEDYSKAEKRHKKPKADVEENLRLNGLRPGKCKEDKTETKKDNKTDSSPQNEPCTVVAPVFRAALSCLAGAIQENKGQRVAFVYIQGHGHSKDIPRTFRGVPRYCLPHDFRGLIQELGGTTRTTENTTFRWHCWPRLMSKVLSLWLARQLTHRLQTLLPQTQEKKMKGVSVTSSEKMKGKLKLPLVFDTERPGSTPEQEPLYRSPWRPETPLSQVSPAGQTQMFVLLET